VTPRSETSPPGPHRPELPAPAGPSAVLTTIIIVVVVASLYFGRDIFVPVALSILLSFALAPPVRWLHRMHVPRLPSVLIVVTLAFAFILAFCAVVAWQVADLAQRLPAYQQNIETKIDNFLETPPGGGMFGRASKMIEDIGRKIEEETEDAAAAEAAAEPGVPDEEPKPVPVVVSQPDPTSTQILRTIVGPLINPLATAGIVIVFVIFMLLKREDLRDRLIRLLGPRDLSRTTEALDDAARRVGHYLLMQLTVNATYGIPVGIGLWLIGVPNPILWGMLATVLRFVPYIGPIIAAFFPLALAVAVDPSWTTFLWAGALFVVIELISNNAIEPWLYGASTGLSPVAIIAAAIFWTWLWGPIGLLLSTPLTVCLVVLGQHIPQLAFLDVLLGSEPVLSPAETLYQRLLVGDPDEATERAYEFLHERSLEEFYDEVGIAALALAETDRARGALDEERRARLAEAALVMLEDLAEHEDVAPVAVTDETLEGSAAEAAHVAAPANLAGKGPVLCIGGRGDLDEAAAAMLGQLLERRGIEVRLLPAVSLQGNRLKELDLSGVPVIVLSYMNADSLAHARFTVRRLRRRNPDAATIVGFWTFKPEDMARRDPIAATGATRVATSVRDAVKDVIEELSPEESQPAKPVPLTLVAGAER